MKKISVGVLGAIVNMQGQFLLTRRNDPDQPYFHKKWQLVGGGLEYGETPETTLMREFQEELGVVPRIIYPNPFIISKVWSKKVGAEFANQQIILLVYIVTIGDQIPRLKSDSENEILDWKWFDFPQIKRIKLLPSTLKTIRLVSKLLHQEPIKITI